LVASAHTVRPSDDVPRGFASTDAGTRTTLVAAIVFIYGVALQLARLFLRPLELFHDATHVSFTDALAFMGSTLLFQGGFALFAFGVTGFWQTRPVRKLAAWSVQALAVLIAVVETAGHAYFLNTGSTLDYPLVAFSAGRMREVAVLAVHSLSPLLLGSMISAAAAVAVLPWIADRPWARGAAASPPPTQPRWRRPLFATATIASLPLAAAGLLTHTSQAIDRATIRDPVLNVIATFHPSRRAPHSAQSTLDDEPVTIGPISAPGALRNVVIVILESARAESLTPWNASLQDAPFLAELAKSSVRFDRFYTVQTHTGRALRAILCGFEPQHRIRPPKFTHGIATHCLPNLLRDHGFSTVYFQTADERVEHRTFVIFSMGYHDFIGPSSFGHEGFEQANYLGYEDDSMLAPTRRWLEAQERSKPFLATYLTVNAHYRCALLTRHGPQRYSDDPELNCYLNALRADDFFLRALFDEYKAAGLYRNTLFVVVADHGEAFGEHSRRTHNDVPYEEALRVPLLLHDPTGTLVRPGVRADPSTQLDIAPTVLGLLGFAVKSGHFQGSSLMVPHPQVPIRAACYDPDTCLSWVRGDEKFIHHFGRRPDELFDLGRDPKETTNLAGIFPQRAAELKRDLLDWDRRIKDGYAAAEAWTPPPRPDSGEAGSDSTGRVLSSSR